MMKTRLPPMHGDHADPERERPSTRDAVESAIEQSKKRSAELAWEPTTSRGPRKRSKGCRECRP